MNAQQYAQALFQVIKNDTPVEQALDGLDRVLMRRGHTKLKKRILKLLATHLARDARRNTATVHVARAADADTLAAEIDAAAAQIAPDAPRATVIDDTLIGGFAVATRTARLDRSYKRALLRLYRNIIH